MHRNNFPRGRAGFRRPHNAPYQQQQQYQNPQQYQQQHASEQQQNTSFAGPPAPRPQHQKSPAKSARDKQRSEKFRENVGEKTMTDIKAELDKKLFFGFNLEAKAIEGQKIGTIPQARTVPVTTRAIGITLQSAFAKINQTMRNVPQCSVYSAYRVSLAQFEMKMQNSTRGRVIEENSGDNFVRFNLQEGQKQEILSCPVNFNVISSLINAVGNFEYNSVPYYCKLPQLTNHPLTVTFSNLQRTVAFLSDERSDIRVRRFFYNHNPLPGAIWRGVRPAPGARRHADEAINPVLVNPLDFWPENYDVNGLSDDISRYSGLLAWTTRKSLKYVNPESRIDFDGPGLKTCLVSNYCTDLRNPDVPIVENRIDWQNVTPPSGHLDEFWSIEIMDETTMFIGALQLLGEIAPDMQRDPRFHLRSISISSLKMDHRWVAMFNNMIG